MITKIKISILFYLYQVGIAIDQLINALTGGWADETFCSRAYRLCNDKITCLPMKIIDTLIWFDKDHCYQAYMSERIGKQLPPELRPTEAKKRKIYNKNIHDRQLKSVMTAYKNTEFFKNKDEIIYKILEEK